MKMKNIPGLSLLFVVLAILPSWIFAQSKTFTGKDKAFFEAQIPYLEEWLSAQGFSQVLEVESLDVHPQMLTIYLDLQYEDADSSASAWELLRKQYAQNHFDSLESRLFSYITFLMESPPTMTTIEILDTFGDKVPCFWKGIYYENDQLMTEKSGCMAKTTEVPIELEDLPEDHKMADKRISNKTWTQKQVFNFVESFAKDYFENREADFFVSQRGHTLTFEARGMRREVLPEPFFSFITGVPRENLVITTNYEKSEKGFIIHISIDGKFGSGIIPPREGGYRPMEPEYKTELQDYTHRLGEKIRAEILKND